MTESPAGEEKVAVLGGGSWGTALARHLGAHGRSVALWVHDPVLGSMMDAARINEKYLPGFEIPSAVAIGSDLGGALAGAAWILLVVPTRHCARVLAEASGSVPRGCRLIVASKGVEPGSLRPVSRIAREALAGSGLAGVVVLSGPSFAREVAAGRPTAVVAAGEDAAAAEEAQGLLSGGNFRVYTSEDPVGVELGGAFKNVVAIAAGVVEGLGLGPNTTAALLTRGLAEITRLARAMGGRSETLAGLAGVGDLVLTCTGSQSRNFHVGFELGRGRKLAEILAGMSMVAEGVDTTRSVRALSRDRGVSMPISEQVYQVLFEEKPPKDAIRDLLDRPQRPEQD